MIEIDYLLTINTDGVITYDDDMAAAHQIAEWADTGVGEVWGKPLWGCPWSQYRHLPVDDDSAGIIETSLAMKMATDLPNIPIQGIRVMPGGVDLYNIQIAHSKSNQTVSLNKFVSPNEN